MFHKDANDIMLGKQPKHSRGAYSVNRSTDGTTTRGANYSYTAICADTYHDVQHMLKLKLKRAEQMRDIGFKRNLCDMVNAANNEIDLLGHLLTTCDEWYADRTKHLSERTGKVGKQ